jgi:sensor histidine kinase YesM
MSEAQVTDLAYSKDQRRSLRWVDPAFQRRYSLVFLSVVFLVASVLIGSFWFHSDQVLSTLANAGVLKQHSLYVLIETQMQHLLWSVVILSVLFCVFVLIMANFFSHRIVGPIFAIKRSLERIERGEWAEAKISLREQDEFQDVADLVNRCIDRFHTPSKGN